MIRLGNFRYKTRPWKHQEEALEYLHSRNAAALYTDMGSGKTKIMIDLIQNRGFRRVLIICPSALVVNGTWEKQIRMHGYSRRILPINLSQGSVPERAQAWEAVLSRVDETPQRTVVVIANYEGVWRQPLKNLLLKSKFDCVICDESHRIKSPGSKCSMFLHQLGKRVPNRFLMTGTPLAESPMDVYAQYRFLDSTIFGTNYAKFKEPYENIDVRRSIQVQRTVLDSKEPYKNLDMLEEKVFSCAFLTPSTVELPPVRSVQVKFPMSPRAQAVYKQVKNEGAILVGDEFLEVPNILTMVTRLQQISGGFLPLEDDDGNKRLEPIDDERKKQLRELLEQMPKDEPVVVFARFRSDLISIREVCASLGRLSSELSGTENTSTAWQAGETSVLAVQYKSGSDGQDFTRACKCIYYSMTHSLASYEQSKKRVHRPPQDRPVIYYHLIATMPGVQTIDQKILKALREKKQIVDIVMNGGGL